MNIRAVGMFTAMVGVSSAVSALPPAAPSVYSNGPFPPIASTTNLSVHERNAYALVEAIMQVAEGRVHSSGCAATIQPVEVYSDSYANNVGNIVGDISVGNGLDAFGLVAEALPASFRGQKVTVGQPFPGFLAATPIAGFGATYAYNAANNMMVGEMGVQVLGVNGNLDQYSGTVIKDFNFDQCGYAIEDWGVQTLSKLEYPIEKYWQRSKAKRSDGTNGRTVFVKDRLVGNTKCRITVDLYGANELDLFWQDGTMAIELVAPSVPAPAFGIGFDTDCDEGGGPENPLP